MTLLKAFGSFAKEVEYTTLVMSTDSGGCCCGQLRTGCPPRAKLQFCPQRWGLTAERESKQKMRENRRADSGKDADAGKDQGQEKKGVTEDEIVGWYHRLNGHEFEQTPRGKEG